MFEGIRVGAIAVIRSKRAQKADSWLAQLLGRRPMKVAAVALAKKNARVIWAMLRNGVAYRTSTTLAGSAAAVSEEQG